MRFTPKIGANQLEGDDTVDEDVPLTLTDIGTFTDPGVNDVNMISQATSLDYYKPVTYRTSGDCSGASRVNCPTGKQIDWEINVKDITAPTGSDQYPLCVLQFFD